MRTDILYIEILSGAPCALSLVPVSNFNPQSLWVGIERAAIFGARYAPNGVSKPTAVLRSRSSV